jgi:hypothetical protein
LQKSTINQPDLILDPKGDGQVLGDGDPGADASS